MIRLSLRNLSKSYDRRAPALRDASLDIADGEFLVLLGPSGCGKSTLLRLIAGLEEASGGEIWMDGLEVGSLPPDQRDLAMVFQDYALYPHMSVRENLEFGLKLRKTPKAEMKARVEEAGALLGIETLLQRRPAQLSGGQRQRVAIGRAIVRRPKIFLFDEPLSNLDAQLRAQMRIELASLHRRIGATSVYVTHDQVEAMTLADRMVVMREGRIQQIGTPLDIYGKPANRFVAGFLGSPAMNFAEGWIARGPGDKSIFHAGGLTLESGRGSPFPESEEKVVLGFRAESVRCVSEGASDASGKVLMIESLGHETLILLEIDNGPTIRLREAMATQARIGDRLSIRLERAGLHWFTADAEGVRIEPAHAQVVPGLTSARHGEEDEITLIRS